VAGIRAERIRGADIRAGRTPVVDIPVVGIRAADSRKLVQPRDIPVAGMAVDQAIRAAVQAVQAAVPSSDNAPDVVAHEPILSTARAFLNVPPISVA
jgi:phosphoribosylcarboxyaminoimidazole (NCAIR) mutase